MHTHLPNERGEALSRMKSAAPNTMRDFVRVMDEYKVDKFVVQASAGQAKDLRQVCEEYPDRVIPFLTIFSRQREEALSAIERNADWIKGLGELLDARVPFNDPAFFPVMEACARHRLPAIFHCGLDHLPLVRDIEHSFHPRFIADLADRFPDVDMIMGHMGAYYWPEAVDVAKIRENVFLETSGGADRMFYGMIEIAVREAGSDKICYGTDMPLYAPSWQLSKIVDSEISEQDKQNILWKTAAAILRMNPGGTD